jgi:putative addiction module CopG family antidote
MKVSLPSALEDFVSSQVKSGEFDDASEVVGEALRLLREDQESRAMEEMRSAFAGVDSSGGKGEPTARDRAFIGKLIKSHRSDHRRARLSSLTRTLSLKLSFGPVARRDEL